MGDARPVWRRYQSTYLPIFCSFFFLSSFSSFFLEKKKRDRWAREAKRRDTGSSSRSIAHKSSLAKTHSTLWRVTAWIEFAPKDWSKFKRKPMAPYFLEARERERAHPYARNVSRAIELAGFCMPLLKHVVGIRVMVSNTPRRLVRYKSKILSRACVIIALLEIHTILRLLFYVPPRARSYLHPKEVLTLESLRRIFVYVRSDNGSREHEERDTWFIPREI